MNHSRPHQAMTKTQPTHNKLPTYEESELACDMGKATALQKFIYNFEPGGEEECKSFRELLAKAMGMGGAKL